MYLCINKQQTTTYMLQDLKNVTFTHILVSHKVQNGGVSVTAIPYTNMDSVLRAIQRWKFNSILAVNILDTSNSTWIAIQTKGSKLMYSDPYIHQNLKLHQYFRLSDIVHIGLGEHSTVYKPYESK